MRYLIDTCVLSEWKKRNPCPHVLAWLSDLSIEDVRISIITIGEIERGVLHLPESSRRRELAAWLAELREIFVDRIIDLSYPEISAWAAICAATDSRGTPLPAVDSLLAATARAHHLVVATRNVEDMRPSGVRVYNPWTGELHGQDE